MWIVINDNFTASAINPRRASGKRRSVASIASEEIERSVIEISRSKFRSKIKDANCGHHLTNRGHRQCIFSLSLSLILHQPPMRLQSEINSIEHAAQRKLGRGNSVKHRHFSRPIFLEAIYFGLQNTRICIRFRSARYEVGDAKGTKFRVTINIARYESPEHIDSSNINVFRFCRAYILFSQSAKATLKHLRAF